MATALKRRLDDLEMRLPELPPEVEIDFLHAPDISGPEWVNVTYRMPVNPFPLKVFRNEKTGRMVGVWAHADEYPPGSDLRFL